MKHSYLIILFCIFFFLQSITDYFHIQKHLPFLPFSDAGLAQLNNYLGFFLIVVSFLGGKRINNNHRLFTLPLILFIIYAILNNYILGIPNANFVSFRFVKFGLLYLLVILVIRNENDLIKVLKTIMAIIFFKMLVLSFSQAESGFKLLMFATLTIYTPVMLLLILRAKGRFSVKKRLNKFFLTIAVFLPLLSGQRRALIGLSFLALLMALKLRFSGKLIIVSVLSGIALMIFTNFIESDMKQRYSLLLDVEQISEFFSEDGDAYELTSGRKDIWRVYWSEALQSPFFGKGYNVTKQNYGQLSQAQYIDLGLTLKAHNLFLKIFTDYGLLGLIPFLFMIYFVLKKINPIWNTRNKIKDSLISDMAWVFSSIWIIYHVIGIFGHEGPYGKEWYLLYAFNASVYGIYMSRHHVCFKAKGVNKVVKSKG